MMMVIKKSAGELIYCFVSIAVFFVYGNFYFLSALLVASSEVTSTKDAFLTGLLAICLYVMVISLPLLAICLWWSGRSKYRVLFNVWTGLVLVASLIIFCYQVTSDYLLIDTAALIGVVIFLTLLLLTQNGKLILK